MPVKRNKTSKNKRKYRSRKYKGGQQPILTPQNAPQAVPVQPVQQVPVQAVAQPIAVPKVQLKSFPKKIRLNVTSELRSVIEAPEEAEYILAERLNSKQKYNLDSIYQPSFGKDAETGSPVDIYSEYVYERLKDMKRNECQQLKHRGDKKVEGGIFSSDSTRRQECTASVKALIQEDNRILKSWISVIQQNGLGFFEAVQNKIEELQEKIKDLEAIKKEKQIEMGDATSTLEQNKKGIARETQQRLQEITRIISEKEENMGNKIDTEINDLQNYIKEETEVVNEIERLDKDLLQVDQDIDSVTKELQKTINGLNKLQAQLNEQNVNLDELIQNIENSIAQFAMAGGRRKKRKVSKKPSKKPRKKKTVKKKSKKVSKKKKVGRPKKASKKISKKKKVVRRKKVSKKGGTLKKLKKISPYEVAKFKEGMQKPPTIAEIRKRIVEDEEKFKKMRRTPGFR